MATQLEIEDYKTRMAALTAPYVALGVKLKQDPEFVNAVRRVNQKRYDDEGHFDNYVDENFWAAYSIVEKMQGECSFDLDWKADGIHVYVDQIPTTVI
jgi:uncharacterized protein with von Willebrand factor type A (vWA) domain